ncbi:MAG: acetyltransferase [Faecalimonas sp.]|nr:acetyltransferase [Faecalimonas sp.]
MHNRLMIIGAGGHGKVLADIAMKCGYTDIAFLDDGATGTCLGFPILGTSTDASKPEFANDDFVIAIGNNLVREKIATEHKLHWATLVHPTAIVGAGVCLGEGSVVAACAVINPGARVGKHCILNTASIVEHDNRIDDFVHISPGAVLAGTVHVDKGTHIGVGATVKNNVTICGGCTIGAGAVVVRDIEEEGTYVGVPASLLVKKR